MARPSRHQRGPLCRAGERGDAAADHGRHGAPGYAAFLARFPDIRALASAPLDDVLHAWQGLGYYRRARALHACARAVVEQHAGRLPPSLGALRALPGIGAYTAAALAAIAFGLPAVPVDANVERVLGRLLALETPLPSGRSILDAAAAGSPLQNEPPTGAGRDGAGRPGLHTAGTGLPCLPMAPVVPGRRFRSA